MASDTRGDWPVASRRMEVLVVEDNTDFAMLLSEELSAVGFSVTAVDRGDRAIEMITIDRPDVLLVDFLVPGCSGFDVAAYARHTRGPLFPIVGITGLTSGSSKARALIAGCDEILIKPFPFPDLLDAIDRLRARGMPS